ncbi:alpha/beta hydrolase [Liquorilactobacillus mali]|nr:alpha/beta hydrolase [Liquorilactobacillus mali]
MMKRKLLFTIIIIILGCTSSWGLVHSDNIKKTGFKKSNIPTFFIHGYDSSYRAERYMVNSAIENGVTNTVVRANVRRNGAIHILHGYRWTNKSYNPLIEVNFVANHNRNYSRYAFWFGKILERLQSQHHFKKYNVVAHSLGNLDLMYYLLGHEKKTAQLVHQVDIAGPFDGSNIDGFRFPNNRLAADSRPQKMSSFYHFLLNRKKKYPIDQVHVLNIYGNLDNGSNSDGRVSTTSARSLKYLIGNRAKSYHQIEFKGWSAQHHMLRQNPEVSQKIIKFVWGRNNGKAS